MLKNISCDNDEFMAETSEVEEAGTLQDLVIPVYLSTRTSGTKTATFTIETSAGTFTVVAKAKVYDQPDFSQIVVEGAEYITFEINPESPYIVENGVAYNVDCESEDLVASSSDSYVNGTDLTLSFDIPEGKIGYITWEGTIWGDPIDNESYSHIYGDYGIVYIQHYPLNGYGNFGQMQAYADDLENGGDASSRLFSNDDFWASYLVNEPGSHSITFRYYHNGDGVTYGKNRLEISNIRLHVEDFNEYGAELLAEGPIEFEPTYVGFNRYTTANVTLKNTGSMPLSVTGFEAEGENSPFVSILPTYDASFNSTLDVTLVFYPGVKLDANGNVVSVDTTVGLKDTWFTDKVTIKTTAGDFSLDVKGMAKSSEGILLIGDFEDDAYGWDRFDQDGDNKMWDLGTSFWWYERPEYCHSGVQCIASDSNDSGKALTPDNWVVSPEFTVPEGGAMLTWWVGSLHNSLCAEHYSIYIEEDFSDPSKFNDMTPVFSETLEVDPDAEFHERQLDLLDYVGKTVRVAFRHHDCTDQYLLRVDDVFVYTMDKWDEIATSINGMATSNDIVSRQFFNAAGQRVSAPVNGVNIVRQTMNDGSVKAVKVMNKEISLIRMRKALTVLFALLAVCTAGNAQNNALTVGYCDGQLQTSTNQAFGTKDKDTWVSGAIYLPAGEVKTYAGSSIDSVRVGLAQKLGISEMKVWVRETLDGTNLAEASIEKADIVRGWNVIKFDTPCTIPADNTTGLYIGYSTYQTSSNYGMAVLDTPQPNALWVQLGTDAEWVDRSAEGTLCLEAMISGGQLPLHNLRLMSLSGPEVYIIKSGTMTVTGTVKNVALQTITGFDVETRFDCTDKVYQSHVDLTLAHLEEGEFSYTIEPAIYNTGEGTITVTITTLNEGDDENMDDNTQSRTFDIASEDFTRRVLLEEFTT